MFKASNSLKSRRRGRASRRRPFCAQRFRRGLLAIGFAPDEPGMIIIVFPGLAIRQKRKPTYSKRIAAMASRMRSATRAATWFQDPPIASAVPEMDEPYFS
jgi:hypothetical protein